MTTLQVLCPNGRRQNVKVTPNSKLLQVLEDVCQKQKFLPPDDYNLKHGRKILDLTLSVQYANLQNNAKLELVKAEKPRTESEVLIALQLENGERLQHSFSPGTSLWEVLLHWENQADSKEKDSFTKVDDSQSPAIHPVCTYMREEITAEVALKNTKLRTLGLLSGKAAIRLLHRPVDDQTLSEIARKIEREKLHKARLEQSASKQQNPQLTASSIGTVTADQTSMTVKSNQHDDNETSAQKMTESASVQIQNGNKLSDTKSVISEVKPAETPCKVLKLEEEPDVSQSQREPMEVEQPQTTENFMETEDSSTGEKTDADRQGGAAGSGMTAIDRLRDISGIQVFTPDDFNDLPADQQQVARRLAQSFLANMDVPRFNRSQQQRAAGINSEKKQQQEPSPFADFKFPEETKGLKLYNNEMSNVKKKEFQPCERKTTVFNIEDPLSEREPGKESEDLPDDFFELTERDIRSLLAAQQRRLQDIEGQPLMTSAMRRAKLEAEYGRYKRVAIRVQFHDKLTLQGLFRPRETVFAVKKFVKEHLEDKSIPFYLYTAPPKKLLEDDTQTLIEAGLVPATVVYFGSEKQKDHYISESIVSGLSTKLQADMLVAECLRECSDEQESSEQSSSSSSSSQGKRQAGLSSQMSSVASGGPSSTLSSETSDKSVPKWFKVGKK